jgi:Fic family protein
MNIKESPSGKIVKAGTGYEAFVPNPLPPTFEWNDLLVSALSRADHVLGMLAREGVILPNPHLLIRPFVAREAVLSSKIEGTRSSLGEILAQDAGIQVDQNQADLQEVNNYIVALDYGLKRLEYLPLSLRLIREMHAKLMQGARGAHATPGEFRKSQNWIGAPGTTLFNAHYVPPPPAEMMQCLGSFEHFLHDRTLPPLIHVALCHYHFEAIHPFLDGNGRIGRLLIILLLVERKILPSPILYLSAFFEKTRGEYYQQLYNVSSEGSWQEWFLYFLHGVTSQSIDVLSRVERINALLAEWEAKIGSADRTTHDIIKQLARNPYCTAKKVAATLDIAFTTAQRGISKLEDLGIVEQISEGKRDRAYCATAILNILEEQTKIVSYIENSNR